MRAKLIRANTARLGLSKQTLSAWKHRGADFLTRYGPDRRQGKYLWIISTAAINHFKKSPRKKILALEATVLKLEAEAPETALIDSREYWPPDVKGPRDGDDLDQL